MLQNTHHRVAFAGTNPQLPEMVMIGKKTPGRKGGGAIARPAREEQTSTRLYLADQIKLGKLAALKGLSIPEAFRAAFGKHLDSALLAAAELEAAQLRRIRTP